MTVGWGAFGVMWARPMAMIVVRPIRYTHGFTERHDTFTLSAFPESLRPALEYCGSHSGRDGDKAKACGITPVPARAVKAPAFAEAELVVECRKTYVDRIEPGHFLADWIEANYPKKDYHTMYFGEIVAISGTTKYLAAEMTAVSEPASPPPPRTRRAPLGRRPHGPDPGAGPAAGRVPRRRRGAAADRDRPARTDVGAVGPRPRGPGARTSTTSSSSGSVSATTSSGSRVGLPFAERHLEAADPVKGSDKVRAWSDQHIGRDHELGRLRALPLAEGRGLRLLPVRVPRRAPARTAWGWWSATAAASTSTSRGSCPTRACASRWSTTPSWSPRWPRTRRRAARGVLPAPARPRPARGRVPGRRHGIQDRHAGAARRAAPVHAAVAPAVRGHGAREGAAVLPPLLRQPGGDHGRPRRRRPASTASTPTRT